MIKKKTITNEELFNKLNETDKKNSLNNFYTNITTQLIFLSSVILSLAFSDFVKALGSDFDKLLFMFLVLIAVSIFGIIGFRVILIFSELKDNFKGTIQTISILKSFIIGVFFTFVWLLLLCLINYYIIHLDFLQTIFLLGILAMCFVIYNLIYKKTCEKLNEKYNF